MVKRKFAALILTGIGAIALVNNANAEEPYVGMDGCAVLAQLVYAEVTAAAWYGPGGLWTLVNEANDTGIAVCNQTTRTVSKAFTSAMMSIGSPIRWGYPSVHPGDVCLSFYLDQCYPDRNRVGAADTTWSAVSKTVRQAMPNGVATDQSIFNSSTMRLALRFELDQQTVGATAPLAASPYGVGAKARQRRRQ
jgi:hypothetical protein